MVLIALLAGVVLVLGGMYGARKAKELPASRALAVGLGGAISGWGAQGALHLSLRQDSCAQP